MRGFAFLLLSLSLSLSLSGCGLLSPRVELADTTPALVTSWPPASTWKAPSRV